MKIYEAPFAIGAACHIRAGGDRFPCTVIEASKTAHKIVVQDEAGQHWTFTRRKDGRYLQRGYARISLHAGHDRRCSLL